jgi:BirA family biotin operon repressor/biotin-[acetyl-CoA-carboxylase] ligase
LALGGALRAISPRIERLAYKWPNDVLINARKIAGILLESETVARDKVSFVVVGIGVNLTASPQGAEFPASSIMEEGLGEILPEVMLEEFAASFHSWNMRWRAEGFGPVRAAWLAATAIARGEPIQVRIDGPGLCGRFLDIDHEGNLLLDYAGECRRIAAGEVFPAA